VGAITRAVLEGINYFYNPRRIIVIAPREETRILNALISTYSFKAMGEGGWEINNVTTIAEEDFFLPNFGLTLDDLVAQYDRNRIGDQREPGWWIQQLIKLGAGTQIPGISSVYIVWDGDLIPTRRWKLCEHDENGMIKYYIAILQGESRSEFNTTQYAQCMKALTGMVPLEPVEGGTFVAHHMVFHTEYVKEMLDLMAEKTASSDPWPILIMSYSRKFFRFSEYKTYATFMLRYHPEVFNYHELKLFGDGGLRFREANSVIDEMMKQFVITNGGLSYSNVNNFVRTNWKSLSGVSNQQCYPAYVQLDHVYGLEGIINLDTLFQQSPTSTVFNFENVIDSNSKVSHSSSSCIPFGLIDDDNENSISSDSDEIMDTSSSDSEVEFDERITSEASSHYTKSIRINNKVRII
jgi:hypothetical protein